MVTESGSVLIIGQGRSAELCSSTLISRGAGRFRLSGVVTPLQVQELLRPLDSPHPNGKFRKVPERWVVALDDRGERPGAMFADWELIGVPLRVTIGDRGLKDGKVELVVRRGLQMTTVPVAEALSAVQAALA